MFLIQESVLDIFSVMEEVLFNHRNIIEYLVADFYPSAPHLEHFNESTSSVNTKDSSFDFIYKPNYPFVEYGLLSISILKFLLSFLEQTEDTSISKSVFYSTKSSRELVGHLCLRLCLSSWQSLDLVLWETTVNCFIKLLNEPFCSKEFIDSKTVFGTLGCLYDAFKLGCESTLLMGMKKALTVWRQFIIPYCKELKSDEILENDNNLFNFLQSLPWLQFAQTYLYATMKETENKELILIKSTMRKFHLHCKAAIKRHKNRLDAENVRCEILNIVRGTSEDKAERRKSRISERLAGYERANREMSEMWHHSVQEILYNRRVWHSPVSNEYYKLDPTENSQRMRLRVVKNFEGDDHFAASSKRDRSIISPEMKEDGGSVFLPILPDRKTVMMEQLSLIGASSAMEYIKQDYESKISNIQLFQIYDSAAEKCVYSVRCEAVMLLTEIPGRLEITTTHLRFFPDIAVDSRMDSERKPFFANRFNIQHRRPLANLKQIFFRNYKLRNNALEAFFTDGQNFLFSFFGSDSEANMARQNVVAEISRLKPPKFQASPLISRSELFEKSGLQERWIDGKITNFEYLMWLNTYSGRTYNDLTQYPVFPWILRDYESKELNLADPRIYRDLSKPMGALNETRLQFFEERYNAFDDPNGVIPKFHYGSHYSSSAGVVFYLLRMEPFTSFHISLQGGKFDISDRQFHSFANLWHSVTTSSADVKELIPEFFYQPEMLRNINKFDLGKTQKGETLGDVELPPWASTPEEFVRIHREALESDYVSENLCFWIDLIWGYKQKGEKAREAFNLFYYLTYEGAVDIDKILDPIDRRSIEDQIHHFGQTPSQLFVTPHPPRKIRKFSVRGKNEIRLEMLPFMSRLMPLAMFSTMKKDLFQVFVVDLPLIAHVFDITMDEKHENYSYASEEISFTGRYALGNVEPLAIDFPLFWKLRIN
jgi:hypothetical protein